MDESNPRTIPNPQSDYSHALAKAIAWLGDRYLLARPVKLIQARTFYFYGATQSFLLGSDATER
jgi:hypothetical protein